MFVSKKSYQKLLLEKENLASKHNETEKVLHEKERAIQSFLQTMDQDLASILVQHDSVNNQHNVLAEIVGKIKHHFENVNDISVKASSNAIKTTEKGNSLIKSANEMETKSKEGHEAVEKVQKLIHEYSRHLISTEI